MILQLTGGSWIFTTSAIDGNYPNWRQVLPDLKGRTSTISFGKCDLETLGKLKGDTVGFLVKPDGVRFAIYDKAADEWNLIPPRDTTHKGTASRVFMKPEYLKRALDAGSTQAVIGHEFDPVLFTGPGQLVVMPLRISGTSIPGRKTKPTQPGKTMNQNQATPPTSPAQAAFESLRTLKAGLRENIGTVDTAMRQLKEMQADHRATQKDMKSIRGTLKSLKNMAFPN